MTLNESIKRIAKYQAMQQKNDVITNKIINILTAERGKIFTAQQIGIACNTSTKKASMLCQELTKKEQLIRSKIKVNNYKVFGYSIN